jgi:hypothetical protein
MPVHEYIGDTSGKYLFRCRDYCQRNKKTRQMPGYSNLIAISVNFYRLIVIAATAGRREGGKAGIQNAKALRIQWIPDHHIRG